MASAYTVEAESECFCERTRLGEPKVIRRSQRLLQELLGVHSRSLDES